jgi:hypothetical protein
MASFLDLQTKLAAMLGAEEVSELPASDQSLVKDCINTALRVCYSDIDGRRAKWTERELGVRFPEPRQVSLNLVEGSANFTTGDAISGDFAGSMVKVGNAFHTLASPTSFVEPHTGPTGLTVCTLYHSSVALPLPVTAVGAAPELQGVGPLSPFSGRTEERSYRAGWGGDFTAIPPSFLGAHAPSFGPNGSTYTTGRPIFYLVDQSAFTASGEPRVRLNVYPLPDQGYSVRYTANVAPPEMAQDTDTPPLPHDCSVDILLPIARAELVSISRRYNGPDRQLIMQKGEEARTRLRNFTHPQKRRNVRISPLFR